MIEEWRPIPEFPHYLISDQGDIKHVNRLTNRSYSLNTRGFLVVLLSDANSPTRYCRQVNRLVAQAFLDEPEYKDEKFIWHKDGDLTNCAASNLRWETKSRVLEWNEMHRVGEPQYTTPMVRNNETGVEYQNAYACGMAEGELESKIIWYVERQAPDMESSDAKYRYVFNH